MATKSKDPFFDNSSDEIDIYELHKRIELVIRNPHSLIHFPSYQDLDRDLKYLLSAIGHWLNRTPTPTRIFTAKDRSFVFCKHITFDNITDIDPLSQKKRIAATYALSRKSRRFPPFYTLAYHTEYGKTSYWTVSHLKDIITDTFFAHGIGMHVMIDAHTRRPQPVIPGIKAICDNNWINEYPKEFKYGKYQELKSTCSSHIKILNEVRANESKELVHSYPVQLRYHDEDSNKHLNNHAYARYVYDGLMMFDKEVRANKAVLFWMTNFYWKEFGIRDYTHCYVNIWNVAMDANDIKVYVGTIDIDETICKRKGDGDIGFNTNIDLSNVRWKHYHGFMAGVAQVGQNSKL
eukprot:120212_1